MSQSLLESDLPPLGGADEVVVDGVVRVLGGKRVLRGVDLNVFPGGAPASKGLVTIASAARLVEGKGIDVVNDPGQTQTVTITLPPGMYPFICRFHSSLGMKGTLTVK